MTASPDLFIRADATSTIGAGHIMRTMALAQAWCGNVTYLTHAPPAWLSDKITNAGFTHHPIPAPHPTPQDIETVINQLASAATPWLVLDGYHFDVFYQKRLLESAHKVLLMDDGLFCQSHHATLVVNQNLNAEQLPYRRRNQVAYLLGAPYILLRDEFLCANYSSKTTSDTPRILVTLGGSDPCNQIPKVIEAITPIDRPQLEVTIVAGGSNPRYAQLKELTADLPHVVLHKQVDMVKQMAQTDLAITAGGSTCWELAFMGIPSLLLVAAENQRNIANALHQHGVAQNLGWAEDVTALQIRHALTHMLQDKSRFISMQKQGQSIVDGKGRERVVQAMLERS